MNNRTVMQQALEALEERYIGALRDKAMDALRAALAEHFCDTHCTWADHAPGCVRAEPVQEPVAKVELMLRLEGARNE